MPFLSISDIDSTLLLLTDSRFLSQPSQTLFVAITGERHDGHAFIESMMERGVMHFLVNEKWAATNEAYAVKANFYVVKNSLKALHEIAAKKRKKYNLPVVGITGSNGKTIVKEWLSSILQNSLNVVKSPRSYNSQIGVPLSVWALDKTHEVGIFEAGISQVNEMQLLEKIILPEIGIFTNIGSAHNAGFKSQKQKITEKLRLFRASEVLIYCHDYTELDEEVRLLLKAINPKLTLIAWSKENRGSLPVEIIKEENLSLINVHWNAEDYSFRVPFTDDASIENAIHCFFSSYILLSKKYTDGNQVLAEIQKGMDELKPVAMRLELKEGINNCYLIDDSYNNDLGGLGMALNFMSQHSIKSKKTAILSDVPQSGRADKEVYTQLRDMLEGADVHKVIGIGPAFVKNQELFEHTVCYENVNAFLAQHPISDFSHELILVKGAREHQFEKIVQQLIHKVHGTTFEINLDALTHNLNYYRSKLPQGTKLMAMVKASAYGSGSAEVASLMEYHRVNYLAVAYADEGVELRKNGIKLPILVLNSQPESFEKLVTYHLEPELFSLGHLKALRQYLDGMDQEPLTLKVHLKLDTGMNRLGFNAEDISELLSVLNADKRLKVATIFSHLAAADEREHAAFTHEQIKKFSKLAKQLSDGLGYKPDWHLANSAGIINYPEAYFDMVRLGIGLYGVEAGSQHQEHLETVGRLKSVISQIKTVKKGETIGYGRAGKAEQDMQIATVAIGYADGYDRGLSRGVGEVYINGERCPIIGNVCMDMCMVELGETSAKEGDPVELFGEHITIFEIAEKLDTIPYEILTKISSRVKRIFYKE